MCRQQEEHYERDYEHYPAIYWNFPGDAVIIGVHPGKSRDKIGRQIMPGTSFVDIGGYLMLALYLSHPYGGKESNAMDADRIAMELQSKFPQIAVFSPIHAVSNDYATTPYPIGLMYTLELLCRCDIIYFSGDWMNSLGCTTEYLQSKAMGIEQVTSVAELEQRLEHMEPGKNKNNRNRHPINLLYVRKLIDHAKDLLWQEKQ